MDAGNGKAGAEPGDSVYREIGMATGRASTLAAVLDDVLATLCRRHAWSIGHGLRFGEGRFHHHWFVTEPGRFGAFRAGFESWFASTSRDSLAADGILSGTIGEGRVVFVDLAQRPPPFERARIARDSGLAVVAALAVAAEGKPAAVLELYSRVPLHDREAVGRLLEFVAGQLSQVASRERLAGAVRSAAGTSRRLKASLEETLERQRASDRARGGLYDPLTLLPTRPLLVDRLEHALRRKSRSPDRLFSLLVWRVRLGRGAGPSDPVRDRAVRQAVARRMAACLRPGDTLAQMAEDEFAVLLEEVSDAERARGIAERIRATVARPIRITGREIPVDHSIGIAVARPGHGRSEAVLESAQDAAVRAEREGTGICIR